MRHGAQSQSEEGGTVKDVLFLMKSKGATTKKTTVVEEENAKGTQNPSGIGKLNSCGQQSLLVRCVSLLRSI